MLASGIELKRTVAFLGLSGAVSIRAVSLREPSDVNGTDSAKDVAKSSLVGGADGGITGRAGAAGGSGGRGGGGSGSKGKNEEGEIAATDWAAAAFFAEGGSAFSARSVWPTGGGGATGGVRFTSGGMGFAANGGMTGGRIDGALFDGATEANCGGLIFGGGIGLTSGGGGIAAADCAAAGFSDRNAALSTGAGSGDGTSCFASSTSHRGDGGVAADAGGRASFNTGADACGCDGGGATGNGDGVRTPGGRCGILARTVCS
ncbi:MAG: hypothetical protein ACREFG_13030 [Chthoniobacterales bacterium]